MATPTGPRADSARGFYARERRRKKQNQKDFDIAGLVATPFDFGATAAGGSSANALTLPADIKLAFESSVALAAGDFGVEDVSAGVTSFSGDAAPALGVINMRPLFRERRQIRIARAVGAPAATVKIYFRGPKSQIVQIGTVTFT